MKKYLLSALLIAISMQGPLFAQGQYGSGHSKEDWSFNIYPPVVNHRHIAHLQKNEKMIIELEDVDDYTMLKDIDTILTAMMQDIAFYKDSISASGSVRIDYRVANGIPSRMIRVKQYPEQSAVFIKQDNGTSVLKIAQDTVHILVTEKVTNTNDSAKFFYHRVQLIFCLNNYTDISTLMRDKISLQNIVDTLSRVVTNKRRHLEKDGSYRRRAQSTVNYSPYNTKGKTLKMNYLVDDEWNIIPHSKKNNIQVNARLGAGLVMNTISPMADIGLQYNYFWGSWVRDHDIYRLSVTPYYLFGRDAQGNIIANDNWFINVQIGSLYDTPDQLWVGNAHTIGIGYLVSEKGGYFKGTTMKLFTDLQIVKGFTIVPEVIATNNFKQFFPGITLKVF